jgi:hypothetical protein
MPYRISYLDTSLSADERLTAGMSQTEEFSTEPAALARARELILPPSRDFVLGQFRASGRSILQLKLGLTAE